MQKLARRLAPASATLIATKTIQPRKQDRYYLSRCSLSMSSSHHQPTSPASAQAQASAKRARDAADGLRAIIAPSMLSCDFARLAEEAKRMLSLGADWLHMDVMDGHFVPNLTLGAPIVKALRAHVPDAFLDCHLMVTDPGAWLADFKEAGASQITFHLETVDGPAMVKRIHDAGMKAGVVIKPKTPVETMFASIDAGADNALIMTVEPGFGGQKFMADQMPKVRTLRARYPTLNIQVDGGVAADTIDTCAAAGANVVVSGSGIFKAKDPGVAIATLRASVNSALAK